MNALNGWDAREYTPTAREPSPCRGTWQWVRGVRLDHDSMHQLPASSSDELVGQVEPRRVQVEAALGVPAGRITHHLDRIDHRHRLALQQGDQLGNRGNANTSRRTKINSFNPPSTPVCTAYATPPFLPLFHHQSSWPALDHMAVFTSIGGSTSRRSASVICSKSPFLRSMLIRT
jgi:hypothetical protein